MNTDNSGKFRGCWMFDTHKADYYLGDSNEIVGIQCADIQKEVIGIQTGLVIGGYIGNPGVSALRVSQGAEIDAILEELTQTYLQRINKWLPQEQAA